MNDITEETIKKLRTIPESPKLAEPEAFADAVLARIPTTYGIFKWAPLVRRLGYAAAITFILVTVGWILNGQSQVNESHINTWYPQKAEEACSEQKIKDMANAVKLYEQIKTSRL